MTQEVDTPQHHQSGARSPTWQLSLPNIAKAVAWKSALIARPWQTVAGHQA
ncbi:hypothetical protein [Streptomyces sp. NPDC059979]|uniref:hypothetical protein n=1 Tax=Streptomyces sp. NPDC059979 TaxID=3347021 RepID=UPI0036BEA19F